MIATTASSFVIGIVVSLLVLGKLWLLHAIDDD
jgi:hypothetical protein